MRGKRPCALLSETAAKAVHCWQPACCAGTVTFLQSCSHLWLILLPGCAGVVPFLEPVTPSCLDFQATGAMPSNSASPCAPQGLLVKGAPKMWYPDMLVQRTNGECMGTLAKQSVCCKAATFRP